MLALTVGWERERYERSAGLRTFPLVAVASCGYILGPEADLGGSVDAQARIIEGLITGIDFIGGCQHLKHRRHRRVVRLRAAVRRPTAAATGRSPSGRSGG